MADRSVLYRIRAALQGGFVSVAPEIQLLATFPGVLTGTNNAESALQRIDGTGVGAAIFQFTGAYSATGTNINEWFGGKQLVRMRCTGRETLPAGQIPFDLPGTTALNTAFDQLVAAGLPEMIHFVIEYTGASDSFVTIRPRIAPSPQIGGTTSIIVRSGIAAQVEITRTSGTISDYVFASIGQVSGTGTGGADSIKLQNPTTVNWDASGNTSLPTSVIKGNAYQVVNAPSDGSGRFGEVMQNGDWVVWQGETFTSWAAEPHQWFVMAAHDVRRITALEQDFLTDIQITPVSDRNAVVRGANYADTAGEIRFKIYANASDYSAADLNTTGDVDEYTDTSDQTGRLAIRLSGNQAALLSILPTLYVFAEDGSGNFTKILNLDRDFTHQGDFSGESDYLSDVNIDYNANDVLRIYVGTTLDRYNNPSLDILESNLSDALQGKINRREAWASIAEILFSGATVRDIHVDDRVEYQPGYSHGVDWRDMTQSTTINDNRYLDSELSIIADHVSFEVENFGNTLQKLIGVKLQRNDSNTGDGAMVEIGSGNAFIRINTSNEVQVNTSVGVAFGNETWVSLNALGTNITLGSGGNNFLVFEVNPEIGIAGRYELVADFFDGTNYFECNNIYFTPTETANGNHLGFSRSTAQRGQVLQFKAINSAGYITHADLDSLLRHHQDDKWNFGFARLYEGSDAKEVVLQTELDVATSLRRDDKQVPNVVTGTAAPTVVPDFVGQTFIDTTNKNIYVAVDNTASGDWVQTNN